MATTVIKALRMLEALALDDGPRTLTEMSKQCGMTKSNAHRLLRTLETCHYVRQDPQSHTYEPTLRLWELGTRVFNRLDLRVIAAPHLRALERATLESVHLSVLDGQEVIYIDKVDSRHAVRAYVDTGDRAPAYCTATGKAMLSVLPEDVVDNLLSGELKRRTPNTLTNRTKIKEELDVARGRGYATAHGEWHSGVRSIAAPIRGGAGVVVAGIGISGPAERMLQADSRKQVAAVLKAAHEISRKLGFSDIEPGAGEVVISSSPPEAGAGDLPPQPRPRKSRRAEPA
ncbi:MAG TPA: IclR family transcriptional regulator [Bauldia sp.]|nr:IclR family transcriptional regulator [Bauldia sp.]